MDFKTDRPIFRQIIDLFYSYILNGRWPAGGRIPSVREISVELAVNARTVLSAMDELQRSGIINPKRGMGFFLAEDAAIKIKEALRQEFFGSTLSELFSKMEQLGISIDEIIQAYEDVRQIKSSYI